ncbi:MAG TPA: DinB family protein [Cyclobacteriaceae bacterium]|jgi:hypothetical protein|nr:DinB family protein [Cyclobacteriaceae bacterium]
MVNSEFIQHLLLKGEAAKRKVNSEFSSISPQQLNWKPDPKSWSVGQCLDHIIISDSLYFPTLKRITEGSYVHSFWEKWSPFSTFFGKAFVNALSEEPKTKMKTTKVFLPSTSDIDAAIIDRFYQHHDTFMSLISRCAQINLEGVVLTSPGFRFITYHLEDVLTFLIQHEHRHINQAIRVKEAMTV